MRVVPLLSLLLLLPLKAFGAIAVDNVTTQIATAATITWSHTTVAPQTANTLLIVSISTRGGSVVIDPPTPTYGSQTLTFLGARNNDSNPLTRIEMWYLVNPATGPNTISFTLSASTNVIGTSTSLTGVNQVVPLGAFQSASSTGAGSNTPAVTVVSAPGDMVIDSVTAQGDAGSFTPTGGTPPLKPQNQLWSRFNGTNPAGVAQAGSYALGDPSVTMSWALGALVRWAIGAVSVRPAVTISGTVFEDADFAGTASDYDGGINDLGLQNVDVELYNGITNAYIASATSAADGTYSFPGLSNGTYKVRARSTTIGDADTPPRGGLNGTVPFTWPYPLPEMTWANGAPLYGGQSPTVDDTATGDNAGPGDTYTTVTVTGADVPNVNFGFAYNLIGNVQDDNRNNGARSTQGSLRQFIKNANAIGAAGGTTANASQFRMQVPANQSSGADAWWRFTVANRDLPALSDNDAIIDGSTQRLNSGTDSNSRGPEIEITGFGTGGTAIGLQCSGNIITLRELVITAFSLNGIQIGGSNNRVEGCYVGIDATGTAALGIGEDGILINGDNNTIGGTTPAQRNVISGNTDEGIDINPLPTATGNVVIGNYIGTNATATALIGNGNGLISGGIIVSGNSNRIGGSSPGEANVICGNNPVGVRIADSSSGNAVYGNYIGTTPTGATTYGNTGAGIRIDGNAVNTTIGGTAAGEANTIAYNGGDGVFITGFGSDGNRISGNAIYANGGLGIDLDPDGVGTGGGANNDKTRPLITGLTASGADFIVTATVTAGNTIEFFRANNSPAPLVNPDPSGSGEGYLYLGRCVDNGACSGPYISAVADGNAAAGAVQATLLAGGVSSGDTISATASDAANNTSEFSANSVAPITLAIMKQAWLENGSAPLTSPLTAPAGSTIVFLIYVRNTTAITATDVRINDSLDETAFQFVPGSLVRTVAAAPPLDTAADLDVFNATAPGTGTPLSDAVDGDAASAQSVGGLPDADKITVGAVAGQANGSLTIAGHTTFAIRFRVTVK